jgi:hypothetical protein
MNEGHTSRHSSRFSGRDIGLELYALANNRLRGSLYSRCRYFWIGQFNRMKYRKQYKELKFMVAVHNEKVTMATEIVQHGHILLKGITSV